MLSPPPPEPERHAHSASTVMIVEDEALIAFGLEDLLGDEGFSIAGPFASCASALRALEVSLPDIAILDATLNDGPCLALALELRRRGVPFFIYSGRDAMFECPPELRGVVWVEKPSSFDVVLRTTRRLMAAGVVAPNG